VAAIVLTGVVYKTLADVAKSYGARAFLVKPLTSGEELVEVIRQAIVRVEPKRMDWQGE